MMDAFSIPGPVIRRGIDRALVAQKEVPAAEREDGGAAQDLPTAPQESALEVAFRDAERGDPRAALLAAGIRLDASDSLESGRAVSWLAALGVAVSEPSSPTEFPPSSPFAGFPEMPVGSPIEEPVASTPTLQPNEDELDGIAEEPEAEAAAGSKDSQGPENRKPGKFAGLACRRRE